MPVDKLSNHRKYKSARERFLGLSLESTRKSYYPQLQANLEMLKKNARQLQLLTDNLPARISYIDAEERYIFVNREYEKAFGMPRSRIEGRKIISIIGTKNYAKEQAYIQRVLSGEQIRFEEQFSDRNGNLAWLEINFVPDVTEKGDVIGFYDLTRDITIQKQEQAEKENLEKKLQQVQKMEAIGTLAGGVAHDFNNILFPIMGFSQMLYDDLPENSRQRHMVQSILDAAHRAKDLVKQILTVSRESEHELKPLEVHLVINEVYNLIKSTLPATIEIKNAVSKQCGLVLADPTKLHQITMNLITNAYHAMEETGGTLEISLMPVELPNKEISDSHMKPGRYVCLQVSDTGMGINPNDLERIFDPYFTTKEKNKGTGLGLSIVQSIVKTYSGDIRVASEVNKGTVFKIFLPVMDADVHTKKDTEPAALVKGDERILLVDDETNILKMGKQMLERLGYTVTTARNGINALGIFQQTPGLFDAVITDLTMPKMSGDLLAQKLFQIRPDIPVIICTGYSDKITHEKARQIGISDVIMKPIALTELAQTIRNVLEDAFK